MDSVRYYATDMGILVNSMCVSNNKHKGNFELLERNKIRVLTLPKMMHCGSCGGSLRCEKNSAKIFSGNLDMVRNTDAFMCDNCDQMILTGHGGWRNAPIHEIGLKERYNISLSYEHYSAVRDRPVCADCRKTMDFMGEGLLLLEDEHAELEGKMWVCPFCDYIFIDALHQGWPPPRSLDQKRAMEKTYAPNLVRIGTGVIPYFDSIKKAEAEEGSAK